MIPVSHRLHQPFEYYTPAGGRHKFAFVGVLEEATARIRKTADGYTVEMAVPRATFEGLSFRPAEKLAFEAEVLVSGFGQRGFQTLSRNHLYTPRDLGAPNIVDDIPSEARLYPRYWGEAEVK